MQKSTDSTDTIKLLELLLEKWVGTVLSSKKVGGPALIFMWLNLARALCGDNQEKVAEFIDEITHLQNSSRTGYPPVHALRRRLRELIDADVRELFLVLAVRQAMVQLITIHAPDGLEEWHQQADVLLPLGLQFAMPC